MKGLAKSIWALPAVFVFLAVASLGSACDIDGVTPNCSADGGECITPAGDAYPAPDSGTD
jgi:hypothetical protein